MNNYMQNIHKKSMDALKYKKHIAWWICVDRWWHSIVFSQNLWPEQFLATQVAKQSRCRARSIRKRGGKPCRNLGVQSDRNLPNTAASICLAKQQTGTNTVTTVIRHKFYIQTFGNHAASNDKPLQKGPNRSGRVCRMKSKCLLTCSWSTFHQKSLKAVDPPHWTQFFSRWTLCANQAVHSYDGDPHPPS